MTITRIAGLVPVVCLCACEPPDRASAPEDAAAAQQVSTLDLAVRAMGGAESLRGMSSVLIEASGRRWELDESPRPGGADPVPEPFTWTVTVAPRGGNIRMRIDANRTRGNVAHAATQIISGQDGVISGQDSQFGPPGSVPMSADRQAAILKEQALLNPVAVLRGVLENPDRVSQQPDVQLDGRRHRVMEVDRGLRPIRYFVDAEDGRITKAVHTEIDLLRRDVDIEVDFDDWSLISGGIVFPRRVSLTLDGVKLLESMRSGVSVNVPINDELFEIPAGMIASYDETLAEFGADSHQVYQSMASIGFPRSGLSLEVSAVELAPGVHHIAGSSHHSLVVEQQNGIVVVEAPLHDLRSEAVIDWIRTNLPGKRVTHVIATHHHTDHSAGLRTYAGYGATVVVHERAEDFIDSIMRRSSVLRPDALAENPRSVEIQTVPAGGSLTLPDVDLPVTVYPLPTEHAEDMVFAYVGNAGVAFVSDTYSPNPTATSADAGADILRAAMNAAGVTPTMIAGGHGAVISGEAFSGLFGD